jgi:hypothetical protein
MLFFSRRGEESFDLRQHAATLLLSWESGHAFHRVVHRAMGRRCNLLFSRPLKAQVAPVRIAHVQLLHAIGRDSWFFRIHAARLQVRVHRIHVADQSAVKPVQSGKGRLSGTNWEKSDAKAKSVTRNWV